MTNCKVAQHECTPDRHRPIREALRTLREEFRAAAAKHPPLHHEQLIPPYVCGEGDSDADPNKEWEASQREWASFAEFNSATEDGGWQKWHGPVDGKTYEWFGRFYGDKSGLEDFCYLAESLYLIVRKIDGSLPAEGGYETCLDLMHEAAAIWPTPLLRSIESTWGLSNEEVETLELECDGLTNVSEKWTTGKDGVAFPAHPCIETIGGNLFTAAAQFCEMMASDETMLFSSDMHWLDPDYPVVPSIDEKESDSSESELPHAEASTEPDFMLAFDSDVEKWRLRFRYGNAPHEVEEAWLRDGAPVQYVAFLLERPGKWTPIVQVLPKRVSTPDASVSHERECNLIDGDGHVPQRAKAKDRHNEDEKHSHDTYRKEFKRLREEEDAKERGNEALLAEIQTERKSLISIYNKYFDTFQRERIFLDADAERARRRVQTGLTRFKAEFLLDEKYSLKNFAAEFRGITLESHEVVYRPSPDITWVVNWPSK